MDKQKKEAIRFIDRLYKDLYKSKGVLHHSNGDVTDKFGNIDSYLDSLDSVHNKVMQTGRHVQLIKNMLYKQYVIKEDKISDRIYDLYDKDNQNKNHVLTEEEKQRIKSQLF